MSRFYSRTALLITIVYSMLIGASLIYNFHDSDTEAQTVGLIVIGLPWSLALRGFRGNGYLFYSFALALNVATLYVFVLAIAKVFGRDSN
jgi:hypothetical protein